MKQIVIYANGAGSVGRQSWDIASGKRTEQIFQTEGTIVEGVMDVVSATIATLKEQKYRGKVNFITNDGVVATYLNVRKIHRCLSATNPESLGDDDYESLQGYLEKLEDAGIGEEEQNVIISFLASQDWMTDKQKAQVRLMVDLYFAGVSFTKFDFYTGELPEGTTPAPATLQIRSNVAKIISELQNKLVIPEMGDIVEGEAL